MAWDVQPQWIALLVLNLAALGIHVALGWWRRWIEPIERRRLSLRPYDPWLAEVEREERVQRRAATNRRGRTTVAAGGAARAAHGRPLHGTGFESLSYQEISHES